MNNNRKGIIAIPITVSPLYTDYAPQKIEFDKLPLAADWMPWAVYSSDADSPSKARLIQDIETYNAVVDLVNTTPGFLSTFIQNGLRLSRSAIEAKWGNVAAEKIFSMKRNIFTPALLAENDVFRGRLYDNSPRYCIDVPDYGKVYFTINQYNLIEYDFVAQSGKVLTWNYSDDERDFTYALWEELQPYIASSEDEGNDVPAFGDYESWDQGRYCMNAPDKRLVKCVQLLETHGYVKTYSVCPSEHHPCWNNTDKSDGTLDLMVLDRGFKKDKLLCEKLALVIASKDIYEGKPCFF